MGSRDLSSLTPLVCGSRADDRRRGGDIDLHIEAPAELATFHNEIELEARLQRVLGDRRVDISRPSPRGAARGH